MAIKKSQLYSTLWESCNALRGSMDASQYKDYVLMILFVKYLSDKAHKGERLLNVPEGCYFEDFSQLKQDANIGEKINKKLEAIKGANTTYIGGLELPNFNDQKNLGSGKDMVDTLSKLIAVFENDDLDFGKNRTADDDLLGDAYEYLMKNFAVESGKSKGQFYTPTEVSRVMAKVLHLEEFSNAKTTIYDPTCGSGSLLLRALAETAKGKATLYGQEKDSTTSTLAQLNMFLHGVNNAKIFGGKDTLKNPQNVKGGVLETFDICVANPPFSQKNWLDNGGEDDIYRRWNKSLLPPAKCGDYAFLLHLIGSMKTETGRGACILPHGVLFRGNAEYEIRKKLINNHIIKGIIGLPANIFFGTGIPASIIIIDKKDAAFRNGIFFIDAKDGFMKDGAKNRLREQDIRRIVDVWNAGVDVPHYAKFVSWNEIEANDYNLNIPRYIAPADTEIVQSIESHLNGGLPKHDIEQMQDVWNVCTTLKDNLFAANSEETLNLKPAKDKIAETIQNDDSFKKQISHFRDSLNQWVERVKPEMLAVKEKSNPKELITSWSNSLLEIAKKDKSLVSPYDVYDHLMNYWVDTMQDDCYLVSNDGWVANLVEKKKKGYHFYTDYECDLLPTEIVLNVYFKNELEKINGILSEIDAISQQMTELEENNPEDFDDSQFGEKGFSKTTFEARFKLANIRKAEKDELTILNEMLEILDLPNTKKADKIVREEKQNGLLKKHSNVFSHFDKIDKKGIQNRINEIKNYKPVLEDTLALWMEYSDLLGKKDKLTKQLYRTENKKPVGLQVELTQMLLDKYNSLTKAEITSLVVEKKWINSILARCNNEMQHLTQNIATTVVALAERYEHTLAELSAKATDLEAKVAEHLKLMGLGL